MAAPSNLAYRVARRIAARRVERGLSQEAFAVLLDIAVKNVQRIESGRQNLSLATIERIASVLEVSPEALVAGEESTSVSSAASQSPLRRLEEAGFDVRWPTVRGRRSPSAIPVTTLRAAAGRLTGAASAIEVLGWVALPRRGVPPEGQFVAEVLGASMEPAIPSGALCLFGPAGPPPLVGRTLLVAHEALADAELGGPYALKRVRSVRRRRGGGVHVVLESMNPAFEPIAIDAAEGELRVVAELMRVLG
ncbi:MAG: helix-turn-helix domain-containing protein [Labilithrix sp.]|nr:helix-turn-helix domain-containing protein [Labilithrix sp.]MBX3215420.1 helix-turn-helix domain-containing protein [Labilithrix sp.]